MREIRTYTNAWETRIRIHSIEGVRLPISVEVSQVGIFLASEIVMLALGHAIPALNAQPLVLYTAAPAALTWAAAYTRIEDRSVPSWLWGYIRLRMRPPVWNAYTYEPVRLERERLTIVIQPRGFTPLDVPHHAVTAPQSLQPMRPPAPVVAFPGNPSRQVLSRDNTMTAAQMERALRRGLAGSRRRRVSGKIAVGVLACGLAVAGVHLAVTPWPPHPAATARAPQRIHAVPIRPVRPILTNPKRTVHVTHTHPTQTPAQTAPPAYHWQPEYQPRWQPPPAPTPKPPVPAPTNVSPANSSAPNVLAAACAADRAQGLRSYQMPYYCFTHP